VNVHNKFFLFTIVRKRLVRIAQHCRISSFLCLFYELVLFSLYFYRVICLLVLLNALALANKNKPAQVRIISERVLEEKHDSTDLNGGIGHKSL